MLLGHVSLMPLSVSMLGQRLEDEEGRRRETEGQGEAERPQPPQAEVVSVSMPTQGVVWAAASRVSDRVCLDTISISMCPPVYNDLTGEVPQLPRYITHTLKHTHTHAWVLQELFFKFHSSLTPWFTESRKRTDMMADHKRPTDVTSRAYAAWHRWWKSNLTPNDYLNYLSDQVNLYLYVIMSVRGGQGAVDNHTHTMPEGDEQVQARLERIWTTLHLSETQRLDMAIKYSSATHLQNPMCPQAIVAWEKATNLIQQREKVLLQLEQFEKVASDPNRFFQRGYNGTSAARMEEASSREKLQSQIAALDKLLSQIIHHIAVTFKDTVTYKGRPYGEKMRWDCVEMLYWLQQERRAQALENFYLKEPRLHV
uniref:Uncharacterized protein n=1 Tax=Electrophorus electricus TaxID=8005 RepID=A0A4W4HMC9_ELEEL